MASPSHSPARLLLTVVLIGSAVVGCADWWGPSAVQPSNGLSDDEVAEATRFRESVGLRADRAWIVAVASDPGSAAGLPTYGTPLLPTELAELEARARHTADVGSVVQEYGDSHRSEWAGTFVDNQRDGLVVAQFSAKLVEHEAALRRRLHPEAQVEFREVRWTLTELESFQEQVTAGREALRRFDAWFDKAAVDVPNNTVVLGVSSANPNAASQIRDFYGASDWLVVESDGIGRWEGGRGSAVIAAVDENGRPVAFLDCVLKPDEPAAWRGNLAVATDQAGTCRIEGLGATGYDVELKAFSQASSAWETVGRGRLLVQAGGEVRLRVVVAELPA